MPPSCGWTSTGLSDFAGDDSFDIDGTNGEWREGLRVQVAALNDEARLSLLGRLALQEDLCESLKTRLRLVDVLKRRPEIGNRPLHRPLIIIGLPRTASTLLLHLLSLDPQNRSLPYYEGLFPLPPSNGKKDRRVAYAAATLHALDWLSPMLRHIHQMEATQPEEETVLLRHTFRLLQADYLWDVPSYMKWVLRQDMRPVAQFHKRMLQMLEVVRPLPDKQRWLLKDPAHLFAIQDLLHVYPDACIVQTHRNPVEILASNCALYGASRAMFSDRVDPVAVGQQCLEMWSNGILNMQNVRDRLEAAAPTPPQHSFLDVYFKDVMANPIQSVLGIYASFGFTPPSAHVLEAMRAHLQEQRREPLSQQSSRPRLVDWGLSEKQVALAFEEYTRRHQGRL